MYSWAAKRMHTFARGLTIPGCLLNWKASITMSLSLCPLHFLAEENTTEASHGIGLDLSFDSVFPTAQKDVIVASVN